MKFKYYLFLARKSFFSKKVSYLNIFLLLLSIVMIVCICSFSKTFSNMLYNQINGNIKYRALIAHNLQDYNSLSDIDNILYAIDSSSFGYYAKTENNEEIYLIGVPNKIIDTVVGKSLGDVDETNVMICPSEFYLGAYAEEYNNDFIKKLVNGKKMLNKSIKFRTFNDVKEYKIIGIYDVNKYTYGEYDNCFTKIDNIQEMYNAEINYLKSQCNYEMADCDSIGERNSSIIVVKDINRIDHTIKTLNSNGIIANKLINIDSSGIKFITSMLILMALVVIAINFIIQLISNNKFIHYNRKNNLIYKSLGYSNSILIRVNYIESLILSIISFVLSIIIVYIIYRVVNVLFVADIKTGCPICISYASIIFSFIISIFVPMLSVFISVKSNKNSIIEDFANEEI